MFYKIFSHGAIYLFGELVSKLLPFLMLPLLTHWLGLFEYGQLATYQSYLAMFFILIGYAQYGLIAKYHIRYKSYNTQLVVSLCNTISILIYLLLVSVMFFLGKGILWYVIISSSLFQTFVSCRLAYYQVTKNPLRYIRLQIGIQIILFLGLYFSTKLFHPDVKIYFYFTFLSNFIMFLVEYQTIRFTLDKFNIKYIKLIFLFCSPLIIHHFSIFAKGNLDRILLNEILEKERISFISLGYQIAMISQIAFIAINKSISINMYEKMKVKELTIKNINYILVLCLLVCLFIYIISNLIPSGIFGLIFGEPYSSVKNVFLAYLSGTLVYLPYLVISNVYMYYGWTMMLAFANVISAITHILVLYYFINFNIDYVYYPLVISNTLLVSILYFFIYKRLNFETIK